MNVDDENLVWIDMRNPQPGRRGRARMGERNPDAANPHLIITQEDIEATPLLAQQENRPGGEEKVRTLLAPWLGTSRSRKTARSE